MTVTSNTHKDKLKGLYAITDENLIAEAQFSEISEAALKGGARIIQYRDKSSDQQKRLKQAGRLRSLCKEYQAVCIINDDIELALAVEADGVHLGKDDAELLHARTQLGENAIIGVSCYNDIELAVAAQLQGADYVAFGAMYPSMTKPKAVIAGPDIITQAKKQLTIPICTIGGIDTDNVHQLTNYGADMIAVISTVFASNNIEKTAQQLASAFSG